MMGDNGNLFIGCSHNRHMNSFNWIMRVKSFLIQSDYKKVMPYYIDFVIPGFEKSYPKGLFKVPAFSNRQSEEWFLSFVNKIEESIGNKFLPIYRMGDGEFQVCVGYRHRYRSEGEPLGNYIYMIFKTTVVQFRKTLSQSGFTAKTSLWAGSDDFSRQELDFVRTKLQENIRFVAKKGYLALKFSCSRDSMFAQHYIIPVSQWLRKMDIRLDDTNYIDVYFVYAMLTGPYRHKIYRGRRILVVTSYNETKREAIEKGLKAEGVADVQFLPLSQGRSMYDDIDLSTINQPVDLVLVGRGIGSADILCQLEPLSTVAIDAGYIIECLAYPELKQKRTFCWPDEERNGDHTPI